ncbi:MAG TPA: hypothetical protein GX709_00545 [Clostridiales bacterium]|nr:hypothetical protein [Clostridiales bacterium]
MDIEDLLLQLEQEIRDGRKVLIGNGVIVNPDTIYSIIENIRNSIPDIIREARYIVSTSEKTKEESLIRARNIVSDAKKKADEILSNNAIIKEAEHEAAVIKSQALDYQKRIRVDVADDIDILLSSAEKALEENLEIIKKAKESNARRRSDYL